MKPDTTTLILRIVMILTYTLPFALVGIYFIRKARERFYTTPMRKDTPNFGQRIDHMVNVLVKGHELALQEKYTNLIQTLRTALVLHETSKGQFSAEHTLMMLKDSLLKLDGQCLTLSTEEQRKAEKIIQAHIKMCNENGFKTY